MLTVNLHEIITPATLVEAFQNYHNHAALNNSPLVNLPGVQARQHAADKPLFPGAALAAELKQLIESLEPKDALLPQSHPRRHPYEVLRQTVLLGRSATDTASRLYISRSQLYRIREKAIADLCQLWQGRELAQSATQTETVIPSDSYNAVTAPPASTLKTEFNAGYRLVSLLQVEFSGAVKREPVERLLVEMDGYLYQWRERGFLALFGLPTSREDDVGRAVRAALRLQNELNLKFRCGLSTGRVLVSAAPGETGIYTLSGPPLEIANGLAAASAGEILIDTETFRRIDGFFEVAPAGSDGLTYRIVREQAQGRVTWVRNVRGLEIEMVGREPEWKLLLDLYREARYNQTVHQITVIGAAGSGKSRLEYEFHAQLEGQTRYWRGQAAQEGRLPYQPFAEMLREQAGIEANDSADAARARLRDFCEKYFSPADREPLSWPNQQAVEQGLSRADEIAHFLSVVLDLNWPDSPFLEVLANHSSQLMLLQTFRAFADLCERVAQEGTPLVLVLEDLHWAQETTLALWNYLGAELSEEAILLLGLTRPELYERKPDWGLGLDRHIRLDLKPLSPARTRELIRHILRKLENPPDELVENIAQVADGNPFYVEEIIKMLLDNGTLTIQADGNWQLTQPLTPNPQPLTVPGTVESLIQARLDRLPLFEHRLIELAAVAGRTFSAAALAHLIENAAVRPILNQSGVERLPAGLQRLQQRELISRKLDRTGTGGASQEYLFRHSLLREVIYNNLPHALRAALHRALAEWLVANRDLTEHRSEQGTAVVIAEHYERAGMTEQAATLYEEAGDEARAAYAAGEAVTYYKKAQALGEVRNQKSEIRSIEANPNPQPPTPDPQPLTPNPQLLEKLGFAETVAGLYPAALADFTQALSLTPPTEKERRARLQVRRGDVFLRQGAYREGLKETEEALTELNRKEGASWARLQTLAGSFQFRLGRYAEAKQTILEALAELEKLEAIRDQFGMVAQERNRRALAECCRNLGSVYWAAGDFKPAAEYMQRAIGLNQERSDQFNLAECYHFRGLIHRDNGEYRQARQNFEQACAIFKRLGDRQRWAYCLVNLGIIAWRTGQLDEAQQCFEQGLKISQANGAQFHVAHCYLDLGMVARDLGHLDMAAEYFGLSSEICEKIGDQRGLAYNLAFSGMVQHDRGELEQARELYQKSLSIREKIGHQIGVAECCGRLAKICLDKGELEQGREYGERSLKMFQQAGLSYGLSYNYNNLGYYFILKGEYTEAARWLELALEHAEELGVAETWLEANLLLGRLALAEGKVAAEIAPVFEKVIEQAARRYPLLIASAYLGLAELFLREKTGGLAQEALSKAQNLITEKGLGLLVPQCRELQI